MSKKEEIEEVVKDPSGTVTFQIISLQKDVKKLQLHLSQNKSIKRRGNDKDISAKRSLLKKVAKIRRFLKYLERSNSVEYEKFRKS